MSSFPQKILLSLQYISYYIGKIIRTRRDRCTWSKYSLSKDTIWQGTWSICILSTIVTFLKIVSQNAPDCISAHIHFKKFRERPSPETPLGSSWPLATRDFSPKRQMLDRTLPLGPLRGIKFPAFLPTNYQFLQHLTVFISTVWSGLLLQNKRFSQSTVERMNPNFGLLGV